MDEQTDERTIERKGSPLPRLSFHLHPPTTAILHLPLPPPLTVCSTLATMVVVVAVAAVEVAAAATVAVVTAAVAPPPTLRSSCLLSLSASTLLYRCAVGGRGRCQMVKRKQIRERSDTHKG